MLIKNLIFLFLSVTHRTSQVNQNPRIFPADPELSMG